MLKHRLPGELLTREIKVLLVGAGGTGSRILEGLANLHRALLAKGHPKGLAVLVIDPDRVSEANVGRQAFYPCDVGAFKASTLVNRVNMSFDDGVTMWAASNTRLEAADKIGSFDLVIGAVDSREARRCILRALENAGGGFRYWLDTGNRASDGQVILGQVGPRQRKTDKKERLPHAGELYPELIDPATESDDDTPSCSLAEALEKQSLFINPMVANTALTILWNLFTKGEISYHGAFVNLDAGRVMPLAVDPVAWARFGVVRDGRRRPAKRASRIKKAELAAEPA